MFGIDDAIKEGLELVNKFVPDGNARAEASEKLTQSMTSAFAAGQAAQAATNLAEASNPHVFVAGWRPFIGWICGVILFMWYVPYAIVTMTLWGYASVKMCSVVTDMHVLGSCLAPRPEIGIGDVIALVGSMLGIGTMRTVEKIKGVETTGVVGKVMGLFK